MTPLKRTSFPFIFLSVAMALALSGCTALKLKDMKKPKLELKTIKMKDVDVKGANLLFDVEVSNPNDFSLRIDSLRYEIEIGGRKVGGDQIKNGTEVKAKATRNVIIPLRISFSDVFSSIGDFLRNEMTEYRFNGEAKIGVITLPFDKTGKFKMSDGEIVHEKK